MRRADDLRERIGVPLVVLSGFRCPTHNTKVGGVPRSKHMEGDAVDLGPMNHDIAELHSWAMTLAETMNFWLESPADAPGWLHMQVTPYPGWQNGMSRVFRKYASSLSKPRR